MTDARPPYPDRRDSNWTGWLVALGVVVLAIVGLAMWDYNTEDRSNQTSTPPEQTQTSPAQ